MCLVRQHIAEPSQRKVTKEERTEQMAKYW